MLTAQEAFAIALQNSESGQLDYILGQIKKSAEAGKMTTIIREFGFGSYELNETSKAVIKKLEKLGYTALYRHETHSIAVDMFLEITWGNNNAN